ncbi:type 1 glutamine amidotransferase [Streptomyces griseocarneus]|uniref:type 1 glutamine amidotransferase n=1 Tax=Streptomyces griseocarneus TaxID=51201 RepID=UPI00199AA33A|nr:type 1 glutamine amidotransferase [Streptomyces griseocarneus]MBZ6476170.1 type 1 glutamine amidotransferase [Streptomyces griseocarneus]GHG63601.1 aminotransferase [Streptomyces griseocarneus]
MSRLLVVQNDPRAHAGRLGDWLNEDGIDLEVIAAHDGAGPPARLGHRALLVLGGGYLPDDDERAPWLAPTRALVAQALETGAPFLGVCLGGQLLAHVAGGTVRGRHGAPEIGSTPLTLRPEADDDPLFTGLPRRVTAIEQHVDAITALPPDAVWLVTGEHCPYQAFRVGEHAWGVQFHPEAGPDTVRRWDRDRLTALGLDPDELLRRATADEPAAAAIWRKVAARFARVVRTTVPPP